VPTLNWSQVVAVTAAAAKQTLLELLDDADFTATSWQPFSIAATMLEETALLWERFSELVVFHKTQALLETAEKEALTRLAASHYKVTRAASVTAQRTIVLACAATEGPHEIALGSVVLSNGLGSTYRNVEDGTTVYPVTLTSGGTLTLRFEAEVAGKDANVAEGVVTSLVTTLAGVTVTSDVPFRLGVEEESDARLKERCSLRWALLTRFELIDEGIRALILDAVPGVAVVRVDSTNPRGAGTLDVYVAGADDTSPSEDVTAASDALEPYLFNNTGTAEPTFEVSAAPTATLNLSGIVYYANTFAQADVRAAVEAALDALLLTIPLGGFDFSPGPANAVPKNDVEAIIKSAVVNDQAGAVKTVTLTTPATDFTVPAFAKVVAPITWGLITYTAVSAS
jgi:hypothetical protein